MNSWRDMVKDLETAHVDSVDSAFSPDFGPNNTKDAKDTGPFPQSGDVLKVPSGGNIRSMSKPRDVTSIGSVPDDIARGVQSLRTMRCPKFQDKSVWPVIVADALALATPDPVAGYSMADRAISLGWHPLDLFGFDPRWRSWDDWVSLSAWAQGRKMLVIGERTACLSSQEKTPGHFDRLSKRPRLEDIKFLWELK